MQQTDGCKFHKHENDVGTAPSFTPFDDHECFPGSRRSTLCLSWLNLIWEKAFLASPEVAQSQEQNDASTALMNKPWQGLLQNEIPGITQHE